MTSARYTYLSSNRGLSGLMDAVNEFCLKYPEYRLLQVVYSENLDDLYAILTTDPS